MSFPTALTIALFVAEAAAVVLAVRAAAQKRSGPDRSEPSSPGEPTRTPKRTSVAIAGSSNRGTGKPAFGATLATTLRRVLAFVKRSPLVFLLAFALIDELAVEALHVLVFAGAPRPLAGWARAGWHAETAFVLGWPAALVLATWATKAACPRSLPGTDPRLNRASSAPWPAQGRCERSTARSVADILLGAYLGTLAGLAIVYPPSRASLRWTLLAWELACVAVAWWGLWRARGRTWGAAEVCLVVLVACESAVVIVGPFASDPFLRWWIGRAFYLGAWGLVSAVLVRRPFTGSTSSLAPRS